MDEDILIAMSFDGVREAHDRYRRLPDGSPSFDRLLPKLRMLLAARPYASVLMVVNPDTARWLTESVSFLLDEGCRYLIVSLNYAGAWGEAELEELARQFERLGDLYIEWTRQGRKFYLSPFEVKLSSHIQGEEVCKEHCELGIRQISVDPAGIPLPLRPVHDRRTGEPLVHRRRRFRHRRGEAKPASRRIAGRERAVPAMLRSAAAATTRAAA